MEGLVVEMVVVNQQRQSTVDRYSHSRPENPPSLDNVSNIVNAALSSQTTYFEYVRFNKLNVLLNS